VIMTGNINRCETCLVILTGNINRCETHLMIMTGNINRYEPYVMTLTGNINRCETYLVILTLSLPTVMTNTLDLRNETSPRQGESPKLHQGKVNHPNFTKAR
jgi:hypothetical protein